MNLYEGLKGQTTQKNMCPSTWSPRTYSYSNTYFQIFSYVKDTSMFFLKIELRKNNVGKVQ